MSPKEANAEALRRIREAEETGATSLDLSGLDSLRQLPRELERLISLQTLDLFGCVRLSGDLGPLAGRRPFKRSTSAGAGGSAVTWGRWPG